VVLIGRLGQNAEAKTAQNNKEYVILNIATQESWKNDKGDYETRTEWHRVYAGAISRSSPKPLPAQNLRESRCHSDSSRCRRS
jgi:single-strand DNA-binding protein